MLGRTILVRDETSSARWRQGQIPGFRDLSEMCALRNFASYQHRNPWPSLPWPWKGGYVFSYRGSSAALWLKTNPLLESRPTARLRSARIFGYFRAPVLLGASAKAAKLETSRRHIQQEFVQVPQLWLGAVNIAAMDRLCVRLTGMR